MINERKNILFLDMDGVLNCNYLIRKWCDKKYLELENKNIVFDKIEIKKMVRDAFNKEFKCYCELIFPELAQRLNEVIETCNVKLVWSTSWRTISPYRENINNARAMLERRGINGSALIGYTPNFGRLSYGGYQCRITEIQSFIKENTFGITYFDKLGAIDDCNLIELEQKGIKFFGTEIETGLTEKIKNEMLEYYK